MTVLDFAFCALGATAAVLYAMVDHARSIRRHGGVPGPRLAKVESHARWIGLLMIAFIALLGGTTMTGNFLLNAMIGFIVPGVLAASTSRILLRRRRPG